MGYRETTQYCVMHFPRTRDGTTYIIITLVINHSLVVRTEPVPMRLGLIDDNSQLCLLLLRQSDVPRCPIFL